MYQCHPYITILFFKSFLSDIHGRAYLVENRGYSVGNFLKTIEDTVNLNHDSIVKSHIKDKLASVYADSLKY